MTMASDSGEILHLYTSPLPCPGSHQLQEKDIWKGYKGSMAMSKRPNIIQSDTGLRNQTTATFPT